MIIAFGLLFIGAVFALGIILRANTNFDNEKYNYLVAITLLLGSSQYIWG